MMNTKIYRNLKLFLTFILLFFAFQTSYADEPMQIKETDRCPVCGMFVYKYPEWAAQISFQDGAYYFYDGAKDMFKHYFNVAKYTAGRRKEDIKSMYITDHNDEEFIEAKAAFYVLGSDVLGPMGRELIPFKDKESAQEFLAEHQGKSILSFDEVTPALVESLGTGQHHHHKAE
jgi:copper chaperone NosL